MLKLESTMQTFSLFLKIAMEMYFAQQETNSFSGQVPASLGIHLFFFPPAIRTTYPCRYIIQLMDCFLCNLQWQIQDYPMGEGATPKGGGANLLLHG